MARVPRETYVSPQQHGFPHPPPAVVQRRRAVAIGAAVIVATAIAVAVVATLMTPVTNIPGIARAADSAPSGAPSAPADGETGAIDITEPISPFDEEHPAVSRLNPDLRAAIQAAAADAEADGIQIELTSGWRSADYQAGLLNDAIADYGSEEAAREFVSTPEASKHVTGDAVDVARVDPALWIEQYGNAYGLCRVFANESWHFELATSPGGECPPMLADASEAQ
ncbi:hypothetical protein ACIFOC_00241 [Leucobacter aridicollis]|uniref:M15 family metallopeptidase n=1 Tax=Leucobacter aridicollis TaxID=283878 RepID=UPI000EB53DD7|nr:M15 family metallopeptidase [Leucobacter aridicollis]MCS3426580.1 hypothetical protein [Leucobacter aridicollis]RKQ89269.1 D-alanyl-D-alanine carboxypeptidase-like protein [Mycolicibacterium mucogenicum 261Sha1.1M5]